MKVTAGNSYIILKKFLALVKNDPRACSLNFSSQQSKQWPLISTRSKQLQPVAFKSELLPNSH